MMKWVLTLAGAFFAFSMAALGDSYWIADVSAGAVWSDAANWSSGLPDTAGRANFVNTQITTYDVDVDMPAVLKKILVSQDYTFNGSGSLEIQPASTGNWDPAIEVNQSTAATVFDSDVKVVGTTDYVMDIRNYGTLTFNGSLTLTNTAYSKPINFNASGTTIINGDFYNYCGLRMGSTGTVRIDGDGTTAGTGPLTLGSGRVELNRAAAVLNTAITLTGSTIALGADDALGAAANITLNAGGLEAEGYDQDFGWLDVGNSEVTFDMGSSDSVWTFADSSSQGWGTGPVAISSAGDSVIRFALGSGTGLTASQIGRISINGITLTSGSTTVSNGYLYVVKPVVATGDTTWIADRLAGAQWSSFLNWTAGRPGTAGRANFVNTQSATYEVDVDMAAVLKKILVSQDYTFNGTGSLEIQPASTGNWDPAIEVNQSTAATVFDSDVKIVGTTDYVMDIRNYGTLTFNGSLTLTNTAYSQPVNFNAAGTTIINGDFYNYCGLRMGSTGTVRIDGNGTTVGAGALTLGSGRVELNRSAAVLNTAITLTGSTVSLGADAAIGTPANLTLNGGGLEADGYDQEFGWLDVGSSDVSFDMGGSDSVWTFADSSSQGWGSGNIAISDVGDSVIRFEVDSGNGLTATQIGQISIDGQTLTSGDTRVEDGYLYITPPLSATARYDDWMEGFGLSGSDLLADPDSDGVNNLLEYALGGNPTNSNGSMVLPAGSLTDDGATLEMVYLRRLDAADRGLTYTVQENGDLLADGAWSSDGITETSGAVDANYESVTNRVSTAADAQFIKLSVEFE